METPRVEEFTQDLFPHTNASEEPSLSASKTSAADEILAFSETRALWQQGALRRIYTKGEISEQDTADFLLMLKSDDGPAAHRRTSRCSGRPSAAVNRQGVMRTTLEPWRCLE